MWLATAAVEQRYKDVAYYVSIIASYLLGIASFRRLDLTMRKKTMRFCAFVVMVLFIGSDVLHYATSTRWIPVLMLALAYGIINSIGPEVAGTLTFVVTGHMTKITHQVVDRFSRKRGRKERTAADKVAAALDSAVIGGFFSGALVACFLEKQQTTYSGVWSLLGVLYGVLFYSVDMESMGGAWWLRKNKEMCELDDDGETCVIEESTNGK